ncbi:heavy metal translocatin [Violaceomyces palustris]|uniref:Heavy metal translocatin n=1 Tax=Violaceomyces palustris TaxID=1673888 RepID=A0ACD0P5C0_9BASI|nr:heavy metal translocatin [Violaceomyces palustris]
MSSRFAPSSPPASNQQHRYRRLPESSFDQDRPHRTSFTSNGPTASTPLMIHQRSKPKVPSYTQAKSTSVRVTAVCPSIHCPSCVSFLNQLFSHIKFDNSPDVEISDVNVSLIDHSLSLTASFPEVRNPIITHPISQQRKQKGSVRSILNEVTKLLRREGYSVDFIQSKLISSPNQLSRSLQATTKKPTHLDLTLDGDELTPQGPSQPNVGAFSLPSTRQQSFSKSFNAGTSYQTTPQQQPSFFSSLSTSIHHTVNPWSARREREAQQEEKRRWEKHLEVCQSCRGQIEQGLPQHLDSVAILPRVGHAALDRQDRVGEGEEQVDYIRDHPDLLTSTNASQKDLKQAKDEEHGPWTAQLAVGGMTCASCVNGIKSGVAFLENPTPPSSGRLESIDVSLLSNSAKVVVTSKDVIPKVIEAIEDAGFDVELISTKAARKAAISRSSPTARTEETWKVDFAVGGMTCASCVSGVNSAIEVVRKRLKESESTITIAHFEVALLNGSAHATLVGKAATTEGESAFSEVIEEMKEAMEDGGYDVEVNKKERVAVADTAGAEGGPEKAADGSAATGSLPRRTVRVRIDGMFCSSCVSKVKYYFETLEEDHGDAGFEISDDSLESFSLEKPLVSFTYVSDPSDKDGVSLRQVLRQLEALDPAFTAVYSPPPSLSSRSAMLAKKELRSLLVRLIISFIFAIPTLVLAVISPSLSESHPLRRSLERPVWGGATKDEVLLWALATPVQFGVGSIFHERSWKSIRSVWRKGRTWQERLFRWGDMNVLVSLGTSVAYLASLAFMIVDVVRGPPAKMDDGMEHGGGSMGMTFFDVSVFLIFFILMGRVLESWTKRKTGDAVAELGSMKPSTGQLILDPTQPSQSQTDTVSVDLLEVGDLVLVPSGSSPPLDGTLVATANYSEAQMDESSLSGESKPVKKKDGDNLFSGTANASPYPIVVRVNRLSGQSLIDDILDVVREASGRKAGIEKVADRVTGIFVPVIVFFSVLVLFLWVALLYSGALSERWIKENTPNSEQNGARLLFALQFAVSALVIACPCGIGLAAPTAQLCGIGLASKNGILVNGGGEAFSIASKATKAKREVVFVFDKTGTITLGEAGKVVDHEVVRTQGEHGEDRDELLLKEEIELWKCLDLAEQSSVHPIGSSLREFCKSKIKPHSNPPTSSSPRDGPQLQEVKEEAGKGLVATFKVGETFFELLVGNRRLMEEARVEIDQATSQKVKEWQLEARSVVHISTRVVRPSSPSTSSSHPEDDQDDPRSGWKKEDGKMKAILAISDTIRPESSWLVSHLEKRFSAQVWLISGDNVTTTKAVAKMVGIKENHVVAGVLPTGKRDWVEKLKLGQEVEEDTESQTGARRGKKRRLVVFVGDGINDSPAIASSDLGIALGSGSSISQSSSDFILLSKQRPLISIPVLLSISRATNLKILSNFTWSFVFNASLLPIASGVLMPVGFKLGPSLSGLAMALSSSSVVINALTLRFWRVPPEVQRFITAA